jgi:hypothetical protein
MPEITDTQQRALELYQELWNSPDVETRNRVREHVKKKYPEVRLPVDDIEPLLAPLREENKALIDRFAKLEADNVERDKKAAETDAFSKMQGGVEGAVREYGLTDEGRAKMLDRMKETGNYGDPEAAAAWVASKTPPAPPPNPAWAPQSMNLFGSAEKSEDFAALHKNPEKYLDDQLLAFTRNPDGYVDDTRSLGLIP